MKSYRLLWFVLINVMLVLLSIYKESLFIALFYDQQRQEKKYTALVTEKKALVHELETLKNYNAITTSQKQLGLAPLSLSRVRHIDAHQPS